MRWVSSLLVICIAVIALGVDSSHADKKKKGRKDHPWYPDCVTNFNVCHDIGCNPKDNPTGAEECQKDCLAELAECLPPSKGRQKLETGATRGPTGGVADPGASADPKKRLEGTPTTGGVSPR